MQQCRKPQTMEQRREKTTGAKDTGDNFEGYRDLDHKNETVQKNVKTYLDFLLNELGYEYFQNEFLTDKATGKTYGLFVKDGMNHIGIYNPQVGTVGMGQKASNKIYPRVFKVYGGYAYSVFFDSGSNCGVINRMKIE